MEVPPWSYDFMYVVPVYLCQQAPDPGRLLVLELDNRSS